jgi:hypothetical protein
MGLISPILQYAPANVGDIDILGGSSPSGVPGGALDATYNITAGCVEYNGTQDKEWYWPDFQVPHQIDLSASPRPHIHLIWPTSDAGKVSRWKLEANYAAIGEPLAAAYGSFAYSETVSATNPGEARHHGLVVFPAITIPSMTVSSVLNFRLTRLAATDVLDNDASMIAVKCLDLHQRAVAIGRTVTGT